MSAHIPPRLLSQLSTLIEARMGLHFPEERWRDLERKIQAAAHELGMPDATACAEWLVSSALTEEQLKLLADYLTVGETYFFRDQPMWDALQMHVLPSLLSSRSGSHQTLHFWSAASCTGEEPYSLAILLHQVLPASQAHNATILATDINPSFLHKAAEGVYNRWSFRGVSDALRDRYFHKTNDERFAILPALQEQVRFAELNLAEEIYPSWVMSPHGMDVILCRNVLFYFTPERAQRVVDHLYHSLADGGWLIVSPVEAAYVVESPFVLVQFPGVTFFCKDLLQPARHSSSASSFSVSSAQSREPSPASFSASPQSGQSRMVPVEVGAVLATPETLSVSASTDAASPLSQLSYDEAYRLYNDGHYAQVIDTLIPVCRSLLSSSERHTHYEQTLALLARAYANQGQLSEAQQWCEQAIRANTSNPGLQYLFATILLEQGHPEEARQSLTRALSLAPDFVLAYVALATIARQQHQGEAAYTHLKNAQLLLQRYPRDTIVPESEGITAGRLAEVVATMLQHGAL